jgi:hypothetical protein
VSVSTHAGRQGAASCLSRSVRPQPKFLQEDFNFAHPFGPASLFSYRSDGIFRSSRPLGAGTWDVVEIL